MTDVKKIPVWNDGQYDVCGCKRRDHSEKCTYRNSTDHKFKRNEFKRIKSEEFKSCPLDISNPEDANTPKWELEKALGIKKRGRKRNN